MPKTHRAGIPPPGRTLDALTSYRLLLARTYLLMVLLVGLLLLFVLSLVAYTLWERSELANAHYGQLLDDVARQEYFIEQFEKVSPAYLCAAASCQPAVLRHALPPAGGLAHLAPGHEENFYLLRAAAAPADSHALDDVLSIGMRFVRFDTAFWSGVQSQEKSVFMAADGGLAMFVPHQSPGVPPDAPALELFTARRLAAMRAAMAQRLPPAHGAARRAYWAGPVIDPSSGRSIFICFIPVRDAAGKIIAYAATDVAPGGLVPRALANAAPFKGDFLLFSSGGLLVQRIGHTTPLTERDRPPATADHSVRFSLQHAVVQISRVVPGVNWHVVYAVRLTSMLAEKGGAIGLAVLLCAVLCLLAGLSARRILQRVIRPAAVQAQRLAESEQFNRTIIEMSPVGLAALREQDGALIMQNARFVPLAEWRVAGRPAGAAALPLGRAPPASEGAELAPLQMASAASARHYKVDLARAMHDGVPALLCALTDMTEQKRVEEVLQQARNTAEAASAAKTLFLATLSHDIRTPLYGMLASIELLDKTTLGERQRQLITAMDGAAQTLKDVLNDALDFTKAEAGELTLDLASFDLIDEIERVVRGFWSRAAIQSITLHCFVAPELSGTWRGDLLKLRHILNNLLNNAVKFSGHGDVTVSAALLLNGGTSQTRRITLAVKDTGPGIAARDIERIFLPFEQARTAARGQFSGTGLGLSICRRYAQTLGGRLEVQSVVGEGSAFTLEFPLEQVAEAAAREMPGVLRGLRLQIDAPPETRAYLAAVFTGQGGVVSDGAAVAGSPAPAYLAQVEVTDMRVNAQPPVLLCIDPSLPFEPVFEAGRILVTSLAQKALLAAARMAVAGRAAGAPAVSRAPVPQPGPARLPDIPVLVVDDQPINRLVVQQQLQQLGCRVELVASGAAALARLADHRYALILTDINMPGMNGYELAEACRARGHAMPIIAVTAAALPNERERCLRAGMNDYLLKPFSLAALAGLLERHAPAGPAAAAGAAMTRPASRAKVAETAALASLRKTLRKWNGAMIQTVLQSLSKDLADLRAALASAEASRLEQVAHRVEGGMAALEIRPAVALCRALRDCIEYQWAEQAFGMAPALDAMLRQIMADVQATQGEASAPG